MSFLEKIRDKAKERRMRICLPEAEDARVAEAAAIISKAGIAEVILVRRGEKVERFSEIVEEYCEISRQHKREITRAEAEKLLLEKSVYAGAMMVRRGMADGFVAGAVHETAEVARAALHCVKIDKEIGVMSGVFVMEVPGSKYGQEGTFVFSDCGVVPFPTKEQLAGIAVSAARFAEKILHVAPRVALLSYSTKGSATSPYLAGIREAADIARRIYPAINIDGELQVDAALDPEAASIKRSIAGSPVAGRANVLIFPNLDSGNIAYKLTQRLAGARAVGPILLGLQRPASDLSRACSTDDIVDAVAVVSVMAR